MDGEGELAVVFGVADDCSQGSGQILPYCRSNSEWTFQIHKPADRSGRSDRGAPCCYDLDEALRARRRVDEGPFCGGFGPLEAVGSMGRKRVSRATFF